VVGDRAVSALSKVLRNWRDPDSGDEGLTFFCPGCGDHHSIRTKGATAWGWNGDVEKPTFTPSVLVRSGHYVPGRDKDGCWCTYNAEQEAKGEKPSKFKCEVCLIAGGGWGLKRQKNIVRYGLTCSQTRTRI